MKNSLLYILVFSVAFLFGCKKEDNDPWKDIDFTRIYDYTVTLDANNNVKKYVRTYQNYYTQQELIIYNDTLANIVLKSKSGSTISNIKYYLNSDGYADSTSGYTNQGGNIQPIVYFNSRNYYNQSFLIDVVQYVMGSQKPGHYINDGNNIVSYTTNYDSTLYEYTDTVMKVDVFDFDNELTGKNNRNLIKQKSDAETPSQGNMIGDTYYYYILNNQGYVTSYYTKFVDHSHGEAVTYKRYNFTYEFE